MAQPPPYYPPPGPSQPPPQAMNSAGPPPPAYVYQDHTVTVVQGNATVIQKPPPPKKKTGLLGSFMNEVDKVGKQLGKELDYCAEKINTTIDKNYSSNLLNLFASNNTIQLIPRSSQKTVQILLSADGRMLLDGNGPLDPRPFNTWWTVTNEGQNQVRLSNNYNYLAIMQGCITMIPVTPGVPHIAATKFQLSQTGSFVTMECVGDKGKYIGFLHTGQPKMPCGVRKEIETQFSVKLLSTGYPEAVNH